MDTSSPPESRLAAHTAQLTMMSSTFTAHGSINLNARCADTQRANKKWIGKEKDTQGKQKDKEHTV